MSVIQHKSEEGKKKKGLGLLRSLQVWSLRVVPSRKAFEQISGAMEKSVSFRKLERLSREKSV